MYASVNRPLYQIMACRLIGGKPLSNQYWVIGNWTLRNKVQWNINHNTFFNHENWFEHVVYKVTAILFRHQCVRRVKVTAVVIAQTTEIFHICTVKYFQNAFRRLKKQILEIACLGKPIWKYHYDCHQEWFIRSWKLYQYMLYWAGLCCQNVQYMLFFVGITRCIWLILELYYTQ